MQAITPGKPTGKTYQIADVRQMAAIPSDTGERARFILELPDILRNIPLIEEGAQGLTDAAFKRRPWWAFWLTKGMIRKHLSRSFLQKLTWSDDGKREARVKVSAREGDTLYENTEKLRGVTLFWLVQLEGTEPGEEGDVFHTGLFHGWIDPAEALLHAEEADAREGAQFHSGRVLRCYGPFFATDPVAEKEVIR